MKPESLAPHRLADRLRGRSKAVAGGALVATFALLALLAPIVAPGDPGAFVGQPHQPPSREHWLGTTGQGQDVFAQTVWGARISLAVGFATGLGVMVLAVLVGVTAAYVGGWVDGLLTLATNVFLTLPGLPLAVVMAAFLPPGPATLAIVLVLTGWAWNARVLRAEALSLSRRDFVAAAIVSGEGTWRVLTREVLPNMASLVVSGFIGATVYAISAQVGLEFLGLGNVNLVTWGTNLYWASNNAALLTGAWWTFVPTGLCVALVGFGLTLVNTAVDELTNPRLRADRRAGTRKPAQVTGTAPGPTPGALLELRDLTVEYPPPVGPARVLDGVCLMVRPGEFLGLVGESGSGKSTLAHAVLRLLPGGARVGGEIRVAGRDVLAMEPAELRRFRWREVSLVPQSAMNALNPVTRIGDQFCDVLEAHRAAPRSAALGRGADALAMVGLERGVLDAFPHELSGGMRQRAVIALALVLKPALVILDEPTTALDVVVQREILQRVAELQRAEGFAVLLVSHDLSLLLEFCTRLEVIYAGRIVETAASREMLDGSLHPYTRGLVASLPGLSSRGRLAGISGAPPDPGRLPSGCRFHPRCPEALEICPVASPETVEPAPGHGVACHLYRAP